MTYDPIDTGPNDSDADRAVTLDKLSNIDVVVGPSDDVQSKLDTAGVGGAVLFAPGEYNDQNLSPSNEQRLLTGAAEFVPTADDPVWHFQSDNSLRVGPIRVNDKNGNLTSDKAIHLENVHQCFFEGFFIESPHHGVRMDGTTDGCTKNHIGWMYMTQVGGRGLYVTGNARDNRFGPMYLEGDSAGDEGVLWDTSGSDGGNYFVHVLVIDNGRYGFHINSLTLDLAIGHLLSDSNENTGFRHTAESARSVLVGVVESRGDGNNGIEIAGTSSSNITRLFVGEAHVYKAQNHGVLFNDNINDFYFGLIHAEDNNQAGNNTDGVHAVGTVTDGHIGYLRTLGNHNGLNGAGFDTSVSIPSVRIDDGTENITRLGGVGTESANAETPTASSWDPGDIVDFTDSGDGSGDGVYVLDNDGSTWLQLA